MKLPTGILTFVKRIRLRYQVRGTRYGGGGRSRRGVRGQIATFLILLMVVILIFTMVTANLGQVSLAATRLANASDAAALMLGSQLATFGNQYSGQLGGDTEECHKEGPLITVLAIITIIVALIIFVASGGTLTPASMALIATVAGALGGGIGGIIQYGGLKGFLMGALQGAAIGAAIGGGAYVAAGIFGATVAALLAGGFVGAGLKILASVLIDQMKSDAFQALAKKLQALPPDLAMQQGIIFLALSRVVDDPTLVPDTYDLNGNGNTTEQVPRFLWWWDRRLEDIKIALGDMPQTIRDFVNGPLESMRDFARSTYQTSGSPIAGLLRRQEIEETDGLLVEVLRSLEDPSSRGSSTNTTAYPVSFWQAGPSKASGVGDLCLGSDNRDIWCWSQCSATSTEYPCCNYTCSTTCDPNSRPSCPNLPRNPDPTCVATCSNWDSVDVTNERLRDFARQASGIINSDPVPTWQSWRLLFYNPDSDKDFYDVLGTIRNQVPAQPDFKSIQEWITELETIRASLPACVDANSDGLWDNPPCQTSSDADADDELALLPDQLVLLQQGICKFRQTVAEFENTANSSFPTFANEHAVSYPWNDTAGAHTITAEVGPFKFPQVIYSESGGFWSFLIRDVCYTLTDYRDDEGSRTWVKMTREDPSQTNLGVWNWNPVNPANPATVSKLSCVRYNGNQQDRRVGVAGVVAEVSEVSGCATTSFPPPPPDVTAPSCPSTGCLGGTCQTSSDCTGSYAGQSCNTIPNPLTDCQGVCQCKPSGESLGPILDTTICQTACCSHGCHQQTGCGPFPCPYICN